jgi:hypothetical protein
MVQGNLRAGKTVLLTDARGFAVADMVHVKTNWEYFADAVIDLDKLAEGRLAGAVQTLRLAHVSVLARVFALVEDADEGIQAFASLHG